MLMFKRSLHSELLRFILLIKWINPLTVGAAYIRIYQHNKYHLINMLKIKYDINQQCLKTVDLHFVKYK